MQTLAGKAGEAISEQVAKKDKREKGLGSEKQSEVSGAGRNSGLSRWSPCLSLTGTRTTKWCSLPGNNP